LKTHPRRQYPHARICDGGAIPGGSSEPERSLSVDSAALEAQEAERDRAGREDTPLNGVHGMEVLHEIGPSIKEPGAEGESGELSGVHRELGGWGRDVDE
jgi:hypothetical protein